MLDAEFTSTVAPPTGKNFAFSEERTVSPLGCTTVALRAPEKTVVFALFVALVCRTGETPLPAPIPKSFLKALSGLASETETRGLLAATGQQVQPTGDQVLD